jgi:hypothetical protein
MPLFILLHSCCLLQQPIYIKLVHKYNLIDLPLLDNIIRIRVRETQTLHKRLILPFRKHLLINPQILAALILPNPFQFVNILVILPLVQFAPHIELHRDRLGRVVQSFLNSTGSTWRCELYSVLLRGMRSVRAKMMAK